MTCTVWPTLREYLKDDNIYNSITKVEYRLYMRSSDYSLYDEITAYSGIGNIYKVVRDYVTVNGHKAYGAVNNGIFYFGTTETLDFGHEVLEGVMSFDYSTFESVDGSRTNGYFFRKAFENCVSGNTIYYEPDYHGMYNNYYDLLRQFPDKPQLVSIWDEDGNWYHSWTNLKDGIDMDKKTGISKANVGSENQPNLSSFEYKLIIPTAELDENELVYIYRRKEMYVSEFEEYRKQFSDASFASFDGDWTLTRIDLDSLKYGYSYSTEQLAYNVSDIRYITLRDAYDLLYNWKSNQDWKPQYYYLMKQHEDNIHAYDAIPYRANAEATNWHCMGIVPDVSGFVKNADHDY